VSWIVLCEGVPADVFQQSSSITAFPVLARILSELKLLQNPVGLTVLAAGVGNDIVGWIVSAIALRISFLHTDDLSIASGPLCCACERRIWRHHCVYSPDGGRAWPLLVVPGQASIPLYAYPTNPIKLPTADVLRQSWSGARAATSMVPRQESWS
jgi:hypothetical protein